MKAPPLSPDDIRQLHTLFLREKTEPISNKAVAADMIKFLALFHFGGLYVDAGLTYADAFDEKGSRYFYDGRVMNIKEQRREFIRLKLTAAVRVPSSPQESTPLPDKNNKTELAAISNYGNSLLKIFGHYDYALTRFEKNREVDLQIMFFSKNANARKFLETLLSDLSSIDSDFKTSEAYDETYDEAYDDYRESKFKNPAIRGGSFTAAMYRKVYNTFCKDHRIYYFDLDSKRFKDFPRIHLKNSKTQKYENYRTSVYLPQDDTGFHSLFFPRGKKK